MTGTKDPECEQEDDQAGDTWVTASSDDKV